MLQIFGVYFICYSSIMSYFNESLMKAIVCGTIGGILFLIGKRLDK